MPIVDNSGTCDCCAMPLLVPMIIIIIIITQVCLMSQSWDSVASMHDHLLTVHSSCTNSILPGQDCPLVPCACADGSGCRGHTPWQSKQVCYGNVLPLLERCYRLLTGMSMNRPRLSLRSRLGG